MKIPLTDIELSKTWLLAFFLPYVIEYGPKAVAWLLAHVPALEALIAPPWSSLATLVATAVLSWISAILASLAKNAGVKAGKVTHPIKGTKEVWEKK